MRISVGRCLGSALLFAALLAVLNWVLGDSQQSLSLSVGYLLGALHVRVIANRMQRKTEQESDGRYKAPIVSGGHYRAW